MINKNFRNYNKIKMKIEIPLEKSELNKLINNNNKIKIKKTSNGAKYFKKSKKNIINN